MTTQPRPASAVPGSNPAFEAARAYYEHNETQAEIAARMGVSRATVSRLLTDARESGIVRIQVINPDQGGLEDLAARTAAALGVQRVYLAAGNQSRELGRGVNPQARQALLDMHLVPGDVLLVSSGRTLYEVGRTQLPPLPGVVVAPTVGGQAEPEPWYQTNEITRAVAQQLQAHPAFLFAEAKPSPVMFEALQHDPGFGHIQQLWAGARGALVGIGAPTSTRSSISPAIPTESEALRHAVGDVCLNFFEIDGTPLDFPGHERMIRTPLSVLRDMEHCVGIAIGEHKTPSILGAARAGIINRLVTDEHTAEAILRALGEPSA
ncbi:sugar-binding transcriptional regulator [Arthrobacter gallicola]|uniref:sugar-binding transcriptional regulator n=1 Tax=Arthrobacter gallicola TaxID=2762225 RepID=UPI001CD86FE8|nr:sugar-binding domain-containing protein [Arthrobacter gallicola]